MVLSSRTCLRIAAGSAVVSFFLVTSGCRSYGGYGTEKALYLQAESTVEQIGTDLVRKRAGLERIRRPDLAVPIEQIEAYSAILDAQERMFTRATARLEGLSRTSSYRTLNSTLGAIITDEQDVYGRYQSYYRSLQVSGISRTESGTTLTDRTYYDVPAFYRAVVNRNRELTLAAALEKRAG